MQRMKRVRKAVGEVAGAAAALMNLELELPADVKIDGLEMQDRVELTECIRNFNYLLGQSLINIRNKGELLVRMRAILERNGYQRIWQKFCQEVLRISSDTAENWISFYEFSMREEQLYNELIGSPLRASAYFQLGKVFRNMPNELKDELREQIMQMSAEELAELDPVKIRAAAASLELKQVKISQEARTMLAQAPVQVNKSDLVRLQKLPKREQVAVAQLAAQHPQLGIRESIQLVSQQNRAAAKALPKSPRIEVEAEVVPEENLVNQVVLGTWHELLRKEESRSIDVLFCELPFEKGWLETHGHMLFELVQQKLSIGGVCLATLGQQDLPRLGSYLPAPVPGREAEELKVGWTCVLHRTHGNYPRIYGINIISGYVPMVILYISPYRCEHLLSDVQSYSNQPPAVSSEWVEFLTAQGEERIAYRYDPNAPLGFNEPKKDENEKLQIDTLERCLRYYLESFIRPKSRCYHLVLDIDRSFGSVARIATMESALKRRASKLITAIHVGGEPDSSQRYAELCRK